MPTSMLNLPMGDIEIQVVANGWIVYPSDPSRLRGSGFVSVPSQVFAFETLESLLAHLKERLSKRPT